MKKNIRKITALLLTAALALSAFSVSPAQAAGKKKAAFDPNGKYHATLGIQTCTNLWLTHMGYYEKSQNSYYNTKNADNLMYTDKETNKDTAATGTLTNAEIAGNGTYTVKLEGLDSMNETDISQLHISTDIPLNDKVKFTDVKASINGREILSFDEGVPENEEPYLQGGMVILLLNHWRAELVKEVAAKGLSETAESGWKLLQGTGDENVEITFTVSGFDYDNPDAVTADETSASENQPSSSETENSSGNSSVPVYPIAAAVIILIVISGIIIVRRK